MQHLVPKVQTADQKHSPFATQTLLPRGTSIPWHLALGEIQTPRAYGSLRGPLEQLARHHKSAAMSARCRITDRRERQLR